MKAIQQHHTTIEASFGTGPDIVDITNKLSLVVTQSTIHNGVAAVFVVGSTGSITTSQEWRSYSVLDSRTCIKGGI